MTTAAVIRVSNARLDELSGAVWAAVSGLAGFVAAVLSGEASALLGGAGFTAGAIYGIARAVRRWRDDAGDSREVFEPLPPSAVIRPAWLVPARELLMGPLILGLCVASCVWSRWGVIGAGGLLALSTGPLMTWLQLRQWERHNAATVYYERMPLLTGGVSRRFARDRA